MEKRADYLLRGLRPSIYLSPHLLLSHVYECLHHREDGGAAEDRYIFTEDACYVDVWRAGEGELVKKIYVGDRIQALAYSSPGGRGDHRDVNDRVYYGISLKTLSTKGLREDHEVIKRSLKNWVELQTKFEFFEGSWRDRNAVKSSDRREAG
ncbi:MAG: hypothetical protein DRN35_00055 [Thermoplasmata archaeon]|nr:MAG: hypothetical protein DRN35_00055 [Thermoplasmata archaeon]